jgi:predicted DNA-binding ribbon-helix-helix protein
LTLSPEFAKYNSMPIPKQKNVMPAAWYYAGEPDERNGLIYRSVTIGRRRSSFRLNAYTWDALRELCSRENITPNMLYQAVAENMPKGLSFTVAVRQHVLMYFRDKAKAAAHIALIPMSPAVE